MVFSEGVAGTAFYVVVSGSLTVSVKGHPVAALETLAGFGELALVNDAPRKATIISNTNSALLRIEKAQFLGAIRKKEKESESRSAVDTKTKTFSLTELPDEEKSLEL